MIHGLTNREFVLSVLRDGEAHFSREFVRSAEGEVNQEEGHDEF